jgi:hypothetical protein
MIRGLGAVAGSTGAALVSGFASVLETGLFSSGFFDPCAGAAAGLDEGGGVFAAGSWAKSASPISPNERQRMKTVRMVIIGREMEGVMHRPSRKMTPPLIFKKSRVEMSWRLTRKSARSRMVRRFRRQAPKASGNLRQ